MLVIFRDKVDVVNDGNLKEDEERNKRGNFVEKERSRRVKKRFHKRCG